MNSIVKRYFHRKTREPFAIYRKKKLREYRFGQKRKTVKVSADINRNLVTMTIAHHTKITRDVYEIENEQSKTAKCTLHFFQCLR